MRHGLASSFRPEPPENLLHCTDVLFHIGYDRCTLSTSQIVVLESNTRRLVERVHAIGLGDLLDIGWAVPGISGHDPLSGWRGGECNGTPDVKVTVHLELPELAADPVEMLACWRAFI